MKFLQTVHIDLNFYLFSSEELILVLFILSIFKFIILCSLVELI